ncbi:hypothetical protein F946_01132 [Acinetobacter johnsonii ANC 3681]|uniref:Uncharacterized protein n=1 Tax=Acinetobacter johnsonii ANC 3681 TaxID=1217662 RepID=N9CYZ1_ACIJO|nr:hypothetical protein [Acinetobacter johnsonii]ENV73620.1 hypothetical protein F946_01132 [Acinetobacter johnsonii ANC 3681]
MFWKILLKDIYYKICRSIGGKETEAEIVYYLDSLIKVQYQPLFFMQLRFNIDGNETITDKFKVIMRKGDAAKYAVGKRVKIKYDLKNIENVIILNVIEDL